jgi:hypothetical protein
MWLTFIALVLVLAALIGSVFAGGIFTIVFIPLAAVAVVAAVAAAMLTRGSEVSASDSDRSTTTEPSRTTPNNLPRRSRSGGHVEAGPAQLADARRERQ